jgi:hypothetical protein
LALCNYILDRLVGGSRLLFSLLWFNFCFVAVLGFYLRVCVLLLLLVWV